MVTPPPLISVVPPVTGDAQERAIPIPPPTAALKVVVPVLVTAKALVPLTVPVKVVFPAPLFTVSPALRVVVPLMETLLSVVWQGGVRSSRRRFGRTVHRWW